MNRKQRRALMKQGSNVKPEPVINVKAADLATIKQQATDKAADTAFILMLALPMLVLRDNWGFGSVRLERFMEQVIDLYDSFNNDYLTIEDMHKALYEEVGIKIHRN